MKLKYVKLFFLAFLGILVAACSNKVDIPVEQQHRLFNYFESTNRHVSNIFTEEVICEDLQPALTRAELSILDMLVSSQIGQNTCRECDQKYGAWLALWAHLDPNLFYDNLFEALKCDGPEYHALIDFCRQQNDEIFLLFYQLAARATCPYDQFLVYPTHDLFRFFPEFNEYWIGVNISLKNEKPNLEDRTCNESTIWCTRKILETKYGHTYASRFIFFYEARKLLLMTR